MIDLYSGTANANIVKEIIITGLINEKFLTKDIGEKIMKEYTIIIVKKGWLGSAIDKLFLHKDNDSYYKFVKLIET